MDVSTKEVENTEEEKEQENKLEESAEQSKESSEDSDKETEKSSNIKATRNSLQISRRLFHMANGFAFATAYAITFTHQEIVYFLGTIACVMYVLDQIRVAYPEKVNKYNAFGKYLLRAEEQLKESAAIPYAFAILLTILTFPKTIAISAIYTLAFADPLSAIIGIKFGRTKLVRSKSLEGSFAFFLTTFTVIALVLSFSVPNGWEVWTAALCVAFLASCFELIPLKLDDNLTIPLFTAFVLWIFCAVLGIAA